MAEEATVRRTLAVYDTTGDALVSEHELIGFDLSEFKRHFDSKHSAYSESGGENDDPQMYCCYEVGRDDVEFLTSYLSGRPDFDFGKYSYFVEATAARADE